MFKDLLKRRMPFIVGLIAFVLSIGIFFVNKSVVDSKCYSLRQDYYETKHEEYKEDQYHLIINEYWIGIYNGHRGTIMDLCDYQEELCFPATIQGVKIKEIDLNLASLSYTPKKVFIPNNNYYYSDSYHSNEIIKDFFGAERGLVFLGVNPEDYSNGFAGDRRPYANTRLKIYVPASKVEDYKDYYNEVPTRPLFYGANVSFMYNYLSAENEGYFWVDSVQLGEKIQTIPNNPEREGYRFTGWYKDELCSEIVDFSEYLKDTEEVVFYAGWQRQ